MNIFKIIGSFLTLLQFGSALSQSRFVPMLRTEIIDSAPSANVLVGSAVEASSQIVASLPLGHRLQTSITFLELHVGFAPSSMHRRACQWALRTVGPSFCRTLMRLISSRLWRDPCIPSQASLGSTRVTFPSSLCVCSAYQRRSFVRNRTSNEGRGLHTAKSASLRQMSESLNL